MPQTQPSSMSVGLLSALALLIVLAGYLVWCTARAHRPRIVCFGDSLTSCGGSGGRYSDVLAGELGGYLIINKGIGGETLSDGRRRFQRDVLDLKPVAVVIALGANDWKRNERSIEALRDDLEFMVRSAREAGIEVVIAGAFGPHPDPAGRALRERHKGSPDLGSQIFQMECDLAGKYGCGHVGNMQIDLNSPDCWDETGHPSPTGNRLVAQRILAPLRQAMR